MNNTNELSQQIMNQLTNNEQMLSFIFHDGNPEEGNTILTKKGSVEDLATNIAGLILGGIESGDESLKRQTQNILEILENALIMTMMENPVIYKRITRHIMEAKTMCDMETNPNAPMA